MPLPLEWEEEIHAFLWMCSRNYVFDVIIIILIINNVFVVVMLQNRQVMVTSFGCCWYSGGASQSLDCWSSCNVWGKMSVGGMEGDSGIDMEDICEDGVRNLGRRLVSMLIKAGTLVGGVVVVAVGVMVVVAVGVMVVVAVGWYLFLKNSVCQ